MRIGYLGELQVWRDDGSPVELNGRRLRSLLVRLALDAGRPVPTRALADSVWGGDEPPADPVNALQSLVSRLRRALGAPSLIEQVPTGYRLTLDPDQVDGARFAGLAARGHTALAAGQLDAAAAALDEALALWRGDPLPDDVSADGNASRAALEDQHLAVLVDRAETDLRSGHLEEALARAEKLAAALPLREDIAALLLRTLVRLGRPAEALAAFERTRSFLRDTLGTDPSAQLRELHLQILQLGDRAPADRADAHRVATNVRAGVTSFLGREDDVHAVRDRLAGYRLVTVVGAGGAGKTRLAAEVAGRLAADGGPAVRDGVWFVELAPVTEPGNVPLALIDGLGLRDLAPLDSRLDRIRAGARDRVLEALAGLSCLVVIDNCEHLVDAVAGLVEDVLAHCPGVRVLATSREPLAIDGEALYALSPLPVPPPSVGPDELADNVSVRLLLDRAAAAGAQLRLDDRTAGPVGDIARRLDGLPLAIELAAARLRSMTADEVAARLGDRFRLLTGGRRTALPRHRTLHAVVEWSWGLLSDAEREVAEYFCLFVAGADATAVAHVCPRFAAAWQADPQAAADLAGDVLRALVDKSLLVAVPGPAGTRFRMLETLREFGADRLAERGLWDDAGLAHARHYAQVARDADDALRTSAQIEGLAVLDVERENILAALTCFGERGDAEAAVAMAVSLGWYWTLRDSDRDALRWFDFVLAVPGARQSRLAPLAEAWSLINGLAGVGAPAGGDPDQVGDQADRERVQADATDLLTRLEPVLEEVPPAKLLSCMLLYFTGDRERAVAALSRTADRDPDPWVRAAARTMHLAVMENEGDVEGLRAELDGLSEQWQLLGDAWGSAVALSLRGQLRVLDGDLDGATRDIEESRRALRQMGASSDELLALTRLGDIAVRRGDPATARAMIDAARAWRAPAGREQLRDLLVDVLWTQVALLSGDPAERDAVLTRLRDTLHRAPAPGSFEAHPHSVAHASVALLALAAGDLPGARASVATAYTMALGTEDQPIIAAVGVAVAAVAVQAGGGTDAAYREAATLLGAAAALRGADDPTHPVAGRIVGEARARLGAEAFAEAYAEGRTLSRAAATRRLDPARGGPH